MKPVGGLYDLAHDADGCLERDLFKLGVHLALPEVAEEAALGIGRAGAVRLCIPRKDFFAHFCGVAFFFDLEG